MSERMRVARAYEQALLAGRMGEVGDYFTDDIFYWVAGTPPLGGEWSGRETVLRAMSTREFGLGPADWDSEDLARDWYEAEDRVIVEIRERSWLRSEPADVMDQRTCVVIRFRGNRICSMRDYTDSHRYELFLQRHRAKLPKFW